MVIKNIVACHKWLMPPEDDLETANVLWGSPKAFTVLLSVPAGRREGGQGVGVSFGWGPMGPFREKTPPSTATRTVMRIVAGFMGC